MSCLIVLAREMIASAVAVVSARGFVESEDAIAGAEKRAQHRDIGEGRRNALDIGVLRAEEALARSIAKVSI